MKKILLIMLCFVPFASFATSMCVENDTVAVVLDPSQVPTNAVGGSLSGGNPNWNLTFSWGKIYGVGACVSSDKGSVVANLTDTINGVEKEIVGGETNGNYCYLKMIHPASSGWVKVLNDSACKDRCLDANVTGRGVTFLRANITYRQTMFSSIE